MDKANKQRPRPTGSPEPKGEKKAGGTIARSHVILLAVIVVAAFDDRAQAFLHRLETVRELALFGAFVVLVLIVEGTLAYASRGVSVAIDLGSRISQFVRREK